MREAVIVSTARTPIGKAYRGAFNNTQGQELAGHAIAQAVKRAGIDGAEVEDVILGCALQQGSTGGNVARQALLRAGLPATVSGQTMDRQCSSGLMAIATAAKQIITDCVAGLKDVLQTRNDVLILSSSGTGAMEAAVVNVARQAALELAEAFTFISEDGIADDVYNRVGAIFTEKEYAALSWACISINAFNRVVIAGRYPVPPRTPQAQA